MYTNINNSCTCLINSSLIPMSKSPKNKIKWKKIKGYPTYKIFTMGDVIRIKDGYKMIKSKNQKYYAVSLTNNSITKRYFVHSLDAYIFREPYNSILKKLILKNY